ncbi:unnamed protein product [Rotaria sp. Silwood2]|nr:unnamed protein product [Rotaria sp. Silwood2]CAF4679991.1 unnamed protein product [Rotaria sp. Silwood2]
MSLELYKRYEIVFLRKNKYGPKFGINRIAKLVNCNRSTVVRWLKRWEETKDLSDRERKGRPRKTTTTDDEIVIGLVRQGVDEGLTSEKIEHHQKKRLTWARSLMNYDWNQVMATDESVFRLYDIKGFYWQRPGERKICRKVKNTIKINAWCCLSAVGFGRIVCFKNNFNSTFLCNNIYHDGLLPAAREHFGRSRNWVLLEDNDPKHRSKASVKWKEDHHVKTLPWPSLSSDMNPVENLWSLLKIKVAEKRPTTVKELIRAIEKEWNDLPQELASNLIDSMKRRVDSLIEANGDYTMY